MFMGPPPPSPSEPTKASEVLCGRWLNDTVCTHTASDLPVLAHKPSSERGGDGPGREASAEGPVSIGRDDGRFSTCEGGSYRLVADCLTALSRESAGRDDSPVLDCRIHQQR